MSPLVDARGRLAALGGLVTAALVGCEHSGGERGVSPSRPEPRDPPDLVLIVVDDWARSDLEAARVDGNPWNDLLAVDALAGQGESWTSFYSQPLCNPTRLALMLGMSRGDDGGSVCAAPGPSTPDASTTLAWLLKGEGYATAAFGKWHIGTNPDPAGDWIDTPAAYGFDQWRAWNASNLDGHCGSRGYRDWHRVDDGVDGRTNEYHTEAVGLAFLDWWHATEGPRFAYVAFQAPHQPLHVPPAHLLPGGYPTPVTNREQYDSMLVAFDSVLASMLAAIDLRSTYVFLVGDNGTPPAAVRADQDRNRVKKTTFQDGVNVPFVVAGPGVRTGETRALGHVVDLPATLAALAGADPPVAMPASISLVPVLFDPEERVRGHVVCDVVYGETGGLPVDVRDTAVVLETARGFLKGRFVSDSLRMTTTKEFFDLAGDPGESNALTIQDPVFGADFRRVNRIWNEYVGR